MIVLSPIMAKLYVILALYLWSSAAVFAAPWTQPAETLYMRSSVSWGSLNTDRLLRADLYLEYGLRERWTLTAKGETGYLPEYALSTGTALRATTRHTLVQSPQIRVSLEAGLVYREPEPFATWCEGLNYEVRGGGVWQARAAARSVAIYAEAAIIAQARCQSYKWELGLNYPIGSAFSLHTQFWSERGARLTPSDKIQSEIIWHSGANDISFAVRRERGGAFDEHAVLLALARRF